MARTGTGGDVMTGKRKCHSESNSFVSAAEQVRLERVLEHHQRRSWCHIAWQAVPHLCTSNRKSMTPDCWPTAGWNVKPFSGGGSEPASLWHVGDTCECTRPTTSVWNVAVGTKRRIWRTGRVAEERQRTAISFASHALLVEKSQSMYKYQNRV